LEGFEAVAGERRGLVQGDASGRGVSPEFDVATDGEEVAHEAGHAGEGTARTDEEGGVANTAAAEGGRVATLSRLDVILSSRAERSSVSYYHQAAARAARRQAGSGRSP
jgi:hypothetical protein